jgi:hypothetical protein
LSDAQKILKNVKIINFQQAKTTHMYKNTGRSHFTPGYVPETHHANGVQNSHLKQCISWILGD